MLTSIEEDLLTWIEPKLEDKSLETGLILLTILFLTCTIYL